MNAKQTVPLIAAGSVFAAAVPLLLIGGSAIVILAWLFSDDNKAPTPLPDPQKANALKILPDDPQPPFTDVRRNVTREDLSAIFNNGSRTLTRTAAVSALKQLGFGKTAAYKALSIDGRFASLLQFAPDGIITWQG
jgi:hypothetical protein